MTVTVTRLLLLAACTAAAAAATATLKALPVKAPVLSMASGIGGGKLHVVCCAASVHLSLFTMMQQLREHYHCIIPHCAAHAVMLAIRAATAGVKCAILHCAALLIVMHLYTPYTLTGGSGAPFSADAKSSEFKGTRSTGATGITGTTSTTSAATGLPSQAPTGTFSYRVSN
jgi:hypothetical protein